ncbi:agamous-like MADS-box protein AGL15 [Salvia miltiorrhiza]|uniref:agamous-like MADS-box protein AGL15 n=1 Tax=Salvia miltiorrhiza TaxID=226208 RepID=UPI0025AB6B8D|nr:agamous-like MADS-box protein AGL15 [Salvia miltiorrhiza]
MGRGKIEIKKIENVNSRQVTFSKRRAGLFKKANELAVLCEAEVAVIIFSNTGKLFEFANSSMKKILSRYKKCVETTKSSAAELEPEKPPQPKEADILKEEIEKLKLKQLRLMGKDLTGMSSQELHLLERQLSEGLMCIKERKEQLLLQELAQCRMQEQRAVLENETLRRQVEELRGFFPPTSSPTPPLCIEYHSSVIKSDPAMKEGSRSPETACNGGLAEEDSDTTLQLGLPYGNSSRKRKVIDGETQSSTSETQFRLHG